MNEFVAGVFALFVEIAGIRELSEFFKYLEGFDQEIKNFFSVIGLIICFIGLLQCFLGYKLFRFWCGVIGLLIGFLIGVAIATSGILSASPASDLIGLLLIILISITGAMVAYWAYLAGLFIYAFSVGFFAVFFLFALFTNSILVCFVAGAVAGTGMGVVAILFRRFWIIVATSISGGMSVMTGLMMVMQTTNLSYGFIIPPALMVAGFFVQNATVKKSSGKFDRPITVVAVPPGFPNGQAQPTVQEAAPVIAAEAAPVSDAEAPPIEPVEIPPEDNPEVPPVVNEEAPADVPTEAP